MKTLIIALALYGSVNLALAADTNSTPAKPNTALLPVPHKDRRADTTKKFARFSGKHFDIVFDGDSIMNRWETTGKVVWNAHYAGLTADFGIEGDRVENVLWRLEQGQVDGMDPKVVMLMIGTNNSGANSADEIAEGITKLVGEYERRCAQAHIILMAIFPRGEKPTDGGRKKVMAVDELIRALGNDPRVTFINIGPQLMQTDGTISTNMMPDFVHPTAKGYEIWSAAIQPEINKYVQTK